MSDGSESTPLEPSHYPPKLSSHSWDRDPGSAGGGLRLSGFQSKSPITFFFSSLYFPFSLCLVSFFLSNLFIPLCPLNSGGHSSFFRPFFFFFTTPVFFRHPSIHPPDCLTGRVCCFNPTDIGSLPRACPGTSDGSPGSCPRIAWWNYGPSRAHSDTHTHTHAVCILCTPAAAAGHMKGVHWPVAGMCVCVCSRSRTRSHMRRVFIQVYPP